MLSAEGLHLGVTRIDTEFISIRVCHDYPTYVIHPAMLADDGGSQISQPGHLLSQATLAGIQMHV